MNYSIICHSNPAMSKFLRSFRIILNWHNSTHFTHICMCMKFYSFFGSIILFFHIFRINGFNLLCSNIHFSSIHIWFKTSSNFYPFSDFYLNILIHIKENSATDRICIICNHKIAHKFTIFSFFHIQIKYFPFQGNIISNIQNIKHRKRHSIYIRNFFPPISIIISIKVSSIWISVSIICSSIFIFRKFTSFYWIQFIFSIQYFFNFLKFTIYKFNIHWIVATFTNFIFQFFLCISLLSFFYQMMWWQFYKYWIFYTFYFISCENILISLALILIIFNHKFYKSSNIFSN